MKNTCLVAGLCLAACGGGEGAVDVDAAPDASADAPTDVAIDGPPEGDHTFVLNHLNIPENAAEATMLGLDIDERPNDGVDNQLGMFFGSLGALAPELDLQTEQDRQIDRGLAIHLVNLDADYLDNSMDASLRLYIGQTDPPPTPAPCSGANDTVCRHHLDGTGQFVVEPASPTDGEIAGRIMNGVFTGGPGNATLQIAVLGSDPVDVPFERAKAELHGLTPSGFGVGKIGGAITQDTIDTRLLPATAAGVRTTFDRDCEAGASTAGCNCTPGTAGETLHALFDRNPDECAISDSEVRSILAGFLTPDIDLDDDGTNDAISFGVGITAVTGTFTVP